MPGSVTLSLPTVTTACSCASGLLGTLDGNVHVAVEPVALTVPTGAVHFTTTGVPLFVVARAAPRARRQSCRAPGCRCTSRRSSALPPATITREPPVRLMTHASEPVLLCVGVDESGGSGAGG